MQNWVKLFGNRCIAALESKLTWNELISASFAGRTKATIAPSGKVLLRSYGPSKLKEEYDRVVKLR